MVRAKILSVSAYVKQRQIIIIGKIPLIGKCESSSSLTFYDISIDDTITMEFTLS